MTRRFSYLSEEPARLVVLDDAGANVAARFFDTTTDAEDWIRSLGAGHETQTFFIAETIAVAGVEG